MERLRIMAFWKQRNRDATAKCLRRLRALPVGTQIDAEQWYGAGWDTANRCIKRMGKRFRIVSGGDSIVAVRVAWPQEQPLYCEFCGPGASCCGVCGRGIVA